jgi:hypothetical protein
VRLEGHQPFGLEDAQRLAHGRAAQRQLPRDPRLVHALAGGQGTADDLLAQMARDLDGQRRGLLEVAAAGHGSA